MKKSTQIDLNDYEGFEKQLPFDCSDKRGGYLLITPNGDALRVSPKAYNLLLIQRNRVLHSFQEESGPFDPGTAKPDDGTRQIFRKLEVIAQRSNRARLPWGFWVRCTLLPKSVVRRIALATSFFYHPSIAFLILTCILLTLLIAIPRGLSLTLATDQSHLLQGYLVFLTSLMIHELGHAAACARYGARPSDIGFAIYLVYPALYSDVNSCWSLNRWKRVIVDLGGAYFQLCFGLVLIVVYALTHYVALKIAFTMILYMILFCLNPIFKFDGYWVLADALGIPNLSRQPWIITQHFGKRFLGVSTEPLPWAGPMILVLAAYAVASNVVWATFLGQVLPMVGASSHQLYRLVPRIILEVFNGEIPARQDLFRILTSGYFCVIVCVMLGRMSIVLSTTVRSGFRRKYANASPASH